MRSGIILFSLIFAMQELSAGLLDEMKEAVKNTQTIQADVLQTKHLSMLDKELEIKGLFALDYSGKLAWHILSPIRYSCIITEKELVQWDAESEETLHINLSKNPLLFYLTESMKASFHGDFTRLAQSFDIQEQPPDTILLTPKSGALPAKFLLLMKLRLRNGHVVETFMKEINGDTTTIRYLNEKINQPVPEALWEIQGK